MSFLSWLFKRTAALPATTRRGGGEAPSQAYLEQRDRLRLAFRDTLGLTGIPHGWMSMKVEPSADGAGDVDALIVLHHWDVRLAQSAPEVERLLRLRVRANGVGEAPWLLDLSWRFEVNAGETVPSLPPSSAWARCEDDGDCPVGWLPTIAVAEPDDPHGFTESTRDDLATLQQARREDARRHGAGRDMRVAY